MESRLEDLEIRFAHQELALEQLSDVVREQQENIDALRAQVRELKALVNSGANANLASPAEEGPPPHY